MLKHVSIIGVGMNLGKCKRRLKYLYSFINRDRYINLHLTSPILKNPPFGYIDQPDFYNIVISISTDLSPQKLLKHLKYIEYKFKRVNKFRNSPRTLDLDIIFFDKISLDSFNLKIPHPYWHERISVILPLLYIME